MPGFTPVHLEVKGPRQATLMQDGVDLIKAIGGVNAVSFRADGVTAPKVTLELCKPFSYEGPAEIQVLAPQPRPAAVAEFLAQVDPAELEAAALKTGGGLGGPGVGESFLIVLRTMAEDLDDDA